jgi:hypothetical protein
MRECCSLLGSQPRRAEQGIRDMQSKDLFDLMAFTASTLGRCSVHFARLGQAAGWIVPATSALAQLD